MPGKRTGWSIEHGVTKYSSKVETEQNAYKQAENIMILQAQNIANFYSKVNELLMSWLNAKAIIGIMRIAYRQFANEYTKMLNQGYSGDILKKQREMLIEKYKLQGLKEDYLYELASLLESMSKTSNNYVLLYYTQQMMNEKKS